MEVGGRTESSCAEGKAIDDAQYDGVSESWEDLAFSETISAYFDLFTATGLSGMKLLDLGCGDGCDFPFYQELGAEVHGIDISASMVAQAKAKHPTAFVHQAPFHKLPYADGSFDIVVSKWALQTAWEIAPIYEEVARVLRPGGRFVFLVVHPIRQFIEKKKHGKDYFLQEIVASVLFNGQVTVDEPTHTLRDWLSPLFFSFFDLTSFDEAMSKASEQIDGDVYPSCFIMSGHRKR